MEHIDSRVGAVQEDESYNDTLQTDEQIITAKLANGQIRNTIVYSSGSGERMTNTVETFHMFECLTPVS